MNETALNVNDNKQLVSKFIKLSSLLCAVMIIGSHAYNAGDLNHWSVSARIIGTLAFGLFNSAVPIFYVISGYLFFCTAGSVKDVFRKQKKRVLTLLVPYLCWSFLYCLTHYAVEFFRGADVLQEFSFFGLLKDIVFYRQEGSLWFLFQLILYVILCPLLYYALKNNVVSICLMAVVGALGLTIVKVTFPLDGASQTIFAFNGFFYFILGSWLGVRYDLADIIRRLAKLNLAVVISGLVVFSFCGGLLFDFVENFFQRWLVPVVCFFLFALLCRMTVDIPQGKTMTRLFVIPTFVVYGMQQMLLRVLVKLLPRVIPWALPAYFIMVAVTAVVCSLIAVVIRKIKFTNFLLNGGR